MLSSMRNSPRRAQLRNAPAANAYVRGREIITAAISAAPSTQAILEAAKDSTKKQGDPEREYRACETVIYVLGMFGSRILEAGLVNVKDLGEALSAINDQQIKVFHLEATELFKCLGHKLQDVTLLNGFFTSLYFLGVLLEEFPRSLPYYKNEYPSLGSKIVLELVRSAIGEDVLRENLAANLNTFRNIVSMVSLNERIDMSPSVFPGFPSFLPCRYSTKSVGDTIQHRAALGKLVKHFEMHGFPQPLPKCGAGPILDWGFLSGNVFTRNFEVSKVDKHIGENLGRTLYWLICEAHRLPAGRAVIVYYDQYIALVRYFGERFGFKTLNAGQDLSMGGSHQQLSGKLRSVFDTWVIIVPASLASAAKEARSNLHNDSKLDALYNSQAMEAPHPERAESESKQQMSKLVRLSTTSLHEASARRTPSISSIMKRKARSFTLSSKSSITSLVSSLSDASVNSCRDSTDGLLSRRSTDRTRIPHVQKMQPDLSDKPSAFSPHPSVTDLSSTRRGSTESTQMHANSAVREQQIFPPSPSSNKPGEEPVSKPVALAIAIYAFEPEEEYYDDELTFSVGDILEIVKKSKSLEEYGWCLARVKGKSWTRLAPLEYLEETSSLPSPAPDPMRRKVPELVVSEQKREIVPRIGNHRATEIDSEASEKLSNESRGTISTIVQEKTVKDDNIALSDQLSSRLQLGLNFISLSYHFLVRLFEPPVEPGKQRIRWRCKCGYQSYDDFEELAPGGIDEWKVFLRQYFDNSSGPRGNGRQSSFQGPTSLVTRFFQTRRNRDEDEEPSGNSNNLTLPISMSNSQRWSNHAEIYILLAFPYRRYGSRLSQPNIHNRNSDRAFFQLLRTSYASTRSRLERLLSLKTIKSVEFAQLELYESGLVDINTALPVPDLPNDHDYIYDPKPPKRNPPVGANFLVHHIFYPEDANDGKPPCLERIPKRKQKLQTCIDTGVGLGWGLHFKEGWDMNVFWLVASALGFLGVVIFFVCWTVIQQDAVGASNIAALFVGMIALLIASIKAVIAMDAI